jgi:hypothetical protein
MNSNNQLTLNFSSSDKYFWQRVQNFWKVINFNNYIFYKEASVIWDNFFNLKINYEKRSFIIKWNYLTENKFWNSNKINIRINNIFGFKSFMYVKYRPTKKEEQNFLKIIQNILNYNYELNTN